MSQSENVAGADAAVWKVGSLSVDELERLAGEIRPSWEIGLDAAAEQPANAAAAMIVPTASGFTAASNAVVADLGGLVSAAPKGNVTQVMGAALAPANANATLVAQQGSIPDAAAVPLHASAGRMTSPIPLVPPARPPQMAYDDAKTEQSTARPWEDDESFAPKKKGKGLLYGVLGSGVVVAGLIAFLAMRGGDTSAANASTATSPTTTEASPTPPTAATAPANAPSTVATNPPPSAPVAEPIAPPPAPAPAPVQAAAVAPPAPAPAVVAAPPAPQPSPVAVTHASSSSRVAPERSSSSSSSHHSSSGASAHRGGSRVRGAGFVTDSPY